MHRYWKSELHHRKLRVVPGIGKNPKLWYHNGPCVRPKCVRSDCIGGQPLLPTYLPIFENFYTLIYFNKIPYSIEAIVDNIFFIKREKFNIFYGVIGINVLE